MYVGLLGGTFNPIHVGHVRLALEVLGTSLPLGALPRVERVELIPCANPAHKPHTGLLPFELRASMARAAIQGIDGLAVNTLEGERQATSYTWDTLQEFQKRRPQDRVLFVMGDEAFVQLDTWHCGLELPQLCDMLIVPRTGMSAEQFSRTVNRFWPGTHCHCADTVSHATPPHGGHVYWHPLPRLDINSSSLRRRWLQGDNLTYLLPDAVLRILHTQRDHVRACWHAHP